MRRIFISAAMALAIGAQSLFAVQAKRGVVKPFVQPDGTVVSVAVRGDERSHVYVSADGYPLLEDGLGNLYFATVDASGKAVLSQFKAADADARSGAATAFLRTVDKDVVGAAVISHRVVASPVVNRAEKKARAAAEAPAKANQSTGVGLYDDIFPHSGAVHSIVVLVEYTDVKFKVNNPKDFFTRMLNEKGFGDYGGTGSARDYFIDSSNNQFRPTFDVYGPVALANNRSYYGENDYYGNDKRPEDMIKEACQALDGEVNFADYDLDKDGNVDNVFVIYAGQGEASYGPASSVWPHQWDLSSAGVTLKLDGKRVDHYACTNEWESGRPDGIGTFVHEFSHVMGLPDLYSYSEGAATLTPGDWSVLDYGPYNNDGCTPPTYSIYERNAMGWIDPIVLDGAASISLEHIETSNQGAIKLTDSKNEFFLFENRQQQGWDKYLPGHGMLIWHIDFNSSKWAGATVNDSKTHQYVDIEEANGKANNSSTATMKGYAFPGTSKNTSFTDDTTPSMITWKNVRLNTPITNIKEENGVISFDVCGGDYSLSAPMVTVPQVGPDAITVAWETVAGAAQYEVNVYDNPTLAKAVVSQTTSNTSCKIGGLTPETDYYIVVYALKGAKRSDPSQVVEVTTGGMDFTYEVPEALDAEETGEGWFTARWVPVDDAVDYLLTVTTEGEGAETYTTDFGTGATLTIPSGWDSDIPASDKYTSKDFSGAAVPSVKFSRSGRYLHLPSYGKPVTAISFWARMALGSSTDTSDSYLTVYGRTENYAEWQTLAVCTGITPKAGGETITIKDIPANIYELKFEYTKVTGNLAFDDLAVTVGNATYEVFNGYDHVSVGGAETSFTVYLDEEDSPRMSRSEAKPVVLGYTVQAVDAEGRRSAESNRVTVEVLPKDNSGVEGIGADSEAPAEYFNMQGIRVDNPSAPGVYMRRRGGKAEKVRF